VHVGAQIAVGRELEDLAILTTNVPRRRRVDPAVFALDLQAGDLVLQ